MARRPASNSVRRFAAFEVDIEAGELRKGGIKIHLQELPFRVLAAVLERPGEVVTREELREKLWSADTFVEFEHSLNTAVNKLRTALNDSSDTPRYIETLPRRGYRFIGALEVDGAVPQAHGAPEPARVSRRWTAALWATGGLALLTVGAIGAWHAWSLRRDAVPEVIPLTTYGAGVDGASFSPDGDRAVFSMCQQGDCSVFIKQIGIESPQRLVRDGQHPVWSPDGRSVLFRRILPGAKAGYFLIPSIGGREIKLVECDFTGAAPGVAPYADWMPDSKRLVLSMKGSQDEPWALFLFSVDSLECTRLTSPKGYRGDTAPAVSPDGRTLLFTRDTGTRPDLLRVPLSSQGLPAAEPRKVDEINRQSFNGIWTANGREIIYCANNFLWRIAASGLARPERLVWAGEDVYGPAISRRLNRLIFGREIWREQIRRLDVPQSPEKTLPSMAVMTTVRHDKVPAYSPDGRRIAFTSDRSGSSALWLCDSDGSNPVKLMMPGGTPQWSPDSEWIVSFSRPENGSYSLYRIRPSGGAPQRLTPPGMPAENPTWSADGRWIYFGSDRTGHPRIWKVHSGGGEAVQVTDIDAYIPRASPDGQFIYFATAAQPSSDRGPVLGMEVVTDLWRIAVRGGKPERILGPVWYFNYAPVGDGVYYTKAPAADGVFSLKFYDLATRTIRTVAKPDGSPGAVISVSPDRRSILYSKYEPLTQDLMLVENFH
jgi:Tol biopolymer transport system component/DNA-binding winged helix-turn-helix (wHTH) protein